MRPALVLVLASFLAASCSGDDDDDDAPIDGTFALTVGCAGAGCGLTGALKIPIHEDDCGIAPLLTISLPAVTTSASDPVLETLTLERRVYCVETWLDVDADGLLSTGDAVDSSGGIVDEAGDDVALFFLLDALEP